MSRSFRDQLWSSYSKVSFLYDLKIFLSFFRGLERPANFGILNGKVYLYPSCTPLIKQFRSKYESVKKIQNSLVLRGKWPRNDPGSTQNRSAMTYQTNYRTWGLSVANFEYCVNFQIRLTQVTENSKFWGIRGYFYVFHFHWRNMSLPTLLEDLFSKN